MAFVLIVIGWCFFFQLIQQFMRTVVRCRYIIIMYMQNRQVNGKDGAFVQFTVNSNGALVTFDKMLYQVQPDAKASFLVPAACRLLKFFKDATGIRRVNAT